jgi:hypothetical protein
MAPDGAIAFATDRRGRWTIDTVRTDGTVRTTVAAPAGAASHPDRQPLRPSGAGHFTSEPALLWVKACRQGRIKP